MIEKENFSLLANEGYGADIATDREDDLDRACLAQVERLFAAKGVVLALDIGGGHGSMSVKMADRGALVTLVDPIPHPIHVLNRASPNIRHAAKKIQELAPPDILGFDGRKLDIIYGQRCLHYLPYAEALATLQKLRGEYAAPRCGIFLSFSSLDCALAKSGYAGRDFPVTSPQRHCVPQNEEAAYLGICHPMTLYRKEEVAQLLSEAGFGNIDITQSAYGNFKALAMNDSAGVNRYVHESRNSRAPR